MGTSPVPNQPRRGPLPGPLGRLAARVYGAAIAHRNRKFDAGRGVTTLLAPVVSVGNLSVGGTGKTPMVLHLCRVLLERGVRPCIAMRGYGSNKQNSTGSDEADVYRREFGDSVDVVAQPNRAAGVLSLLANSRATSRVIVLDDGFQHRQIRRNLDIVLVDASRNPFEDRLLPAGWLRESPTSLKRASCVVITHAELAEPSRLVGLSQNIQRSHGHPPVATTRHLWTALGDAADSPRPLDWLLGKRVVGVCAIGNPRGFVDALRATIGPGVEPELIVLPDHDPFASGTVTKMIETARRISAEAIVVTDKDWSKLRLLPAATWPCPIVRPVLSLGFLSGKQELEHMVLGVLSAAQSR